MSDKTQGECIFCAAAEAPEDRERHVLLRGRANFILLNRYPYNNGHLMIAPRRHLRRLSDSSPEALHELVELAARCERTLHRVYQPHGINMGLNLGRSAGAGFEDHYHLHLVPRWGGDTSFITVTGETRVIPEDLDQVWQRLRAALQEEEEEEQG